ncbi:MFS transporter [Salmonella enterica]|nr:MFS transporter [Salmonella enterica]EJE5545151.1 MFS transporter [Salmonella enterica]
MNTNVYENTDSETITPLNKRRILPVFLLVGLYAASTAAVMSVLPFYIREMGGSPLIIGIIIATEAFSQFCAAFSARAILKMPVLRVLIIVMLCHFFAYGMYSSQLPVFLSDTFIWNGLPFGPKALSYLLMADGVINIFVQLFLLGWVSQYFSERKLIILIFALLCTGFLTAGIATTIPVLVFAIVCISIADALAKPTYLAALSVHVSPARQGIVIGTAQALIAIADFISPVLGGFVLGYALYGVWIGIAISVAIIGLVTAMIYLSKSSVLIVKPETE